MKLGSSWKKLLSDTDFAKRRNVSRAIGIDETASRQEQIHTNSMYNLGRDADQMISDGNEINARNTAFSKFAQEKLPGAEAIAMDTFSAYARDAMANIPYVEDNIVHGSHRL